MVYTTHLWMICDCYTNITCFSHLLPAMSAIPQPGKPYTVPPYITGSAKIPHPLNPLPLGPALTALQAVQFFLHCIELFLDFPATTLLGAKDHAFQVSAIEKSL